jgi:UDP-2,3-diacylglucosamine pyrophosphatase LpxH
VAIKLEYRTVFISDLHLGSRGARARDLAAFLKRVKCQKLYLVGDVIDMWRLKQRWFWPKPHNKVVRRILRMANKKRTEVILVPGNHDEAARQFVGLSFGNVRLQRNCVHETADGKRLLVTHGDEFDLVVQHARLLSVFGSWAYDWLVTVNRYYNRIRARLGLRYASLSQAIKMRVKGACKFISAFEDTLVDVARHKGCDGVVCGHIHKAECRPPGDQGVAYYNCGDWVESCTAIVEHDDGKIQLIDGIALVEALRAQERQMKEATRAGGRPTPPSPERLAEIEAAATGIPDRATVPANTE